MTPTDPNVIRIDKERRVELIFNLNCNSFNTEDFLSAKEIEYILDQMDPFKDFDHSYVNLFVFIKQNISKNSLTNIFSVIHPSDLLNSYMTEKPPRILSIRIQYFHKVAEPRYYYVKRKQNEDLTNMSQKNR